VLINKKAIKERVKELRPGIRVSESFLQALDHKLNSWIEQECWRVGSRKTITGGDVVG